MKTNAKFLLVAMLIIVMLLSLIGVGSCLWVAWVFYMIGAVKSSVLMCVIATAFIIYQARVVFKNKGEIIKDLKEVWHG